jgi:K+ transporter
MTPSRQPRAAATFATVSRAVRVPPAKVAEAERVSVDYQGHGARNVTVRLGIAEAPDVPAALRLHQYE